MQNLTYRRMCSESDPDIPQLLSVYQSPEIARYICIGDNYFHYVTNTENVYFYKVYKNEKLIGAAHLEKQEYVVFMDVLVLPEFQRMGHGARIVKDVQDDVFELDYKRIEISIDETNLASLKLFTNAGFIFVSKEHKLTNFVYKKSGTD